MQNKKHLFLIFTIAVLFSVGALAEETIDNTKFLNPVFYEMLDPIPIHESKTWLTPTKRISEITEDIRIEEDCELIGNEMMSVTLKCDTTVQPEGWELTRINDVTVYTLIPCPEDKGCGYGGGRFKVKVERFEPDFLERRAKGLPPERFSTIFFIID